MAANGNRGKRLAKASLARTNRIEDGDISTTDPRVSPLAQSLGITFDGNNNVTGNTTNDDINTLQSALLALDGRVSSNEADKQIAMNKLNAIATVLGITFNADGTLATESYSGHTHDYDDDGVIKTTTGVN